MKLAFCLFKFFPFGGLQRDFLRILQECQRRRHEIHVYVLEWEGEKPDNLDLHIIPTRAISNTGRCEAFVNTVRPLLAEGKYDAVVGFNKMPGIDVYYAADPCFVARADRLKSPLYRLSRRYKHFSSYEQAVFSAASATTILLLSENEKTFFKQHYGTQEERFHLLPPTLDEGRVGLDNAAEIRARLRTELGVQKDENLLLMVGSGFKTKGLDRAIYALAKLPEAISQNTYLFVVGQDRSARFARLAKHCGVAKRVVFLGGRSDVSELLLAGDLLLHPAYSENTGTVLLEAIVVGLPVLATDVCGYASHIEKSGAGQLVRSPFRQEDLNRRLKEMLTSAERRIWSENGISYGQNPFLYCMPEKATDIVEETVLRKTS